MHLASFRSRRVLCHLTSPGGLILLPLQHVSLFIFPCANLRAPFLDDRHKSKLMTFFRFLSPMKIYLLLRLNLQFNFLQIKHVRIQVHLYKIK